MKFIPPALLLITAISIGLATAQANESRTALVIGNERYEPAVGTLRNPTNDARAVAKTLRGLGFHVIERMNLNRDQLLRAVDEFRKTLPNADVGIFYYAGHGLSIAGSNYLIPIKSGFTPAGADETTLCMLAETHLFNAEQAVADMNAAGARCNIVILDACRSTRLPTGGRTRDFSGRGGLSEMTPPAGSLIAFSTDAGHTAYDGDGSNSLYTEELIKNLASPGLTIEQVFKRTRAGVLKRSDGAQIPAEYSRLVGDDVYLAGEMRIAPAIAVTPTPASTEKSVTALLEDVATFAAAGKTEDCLEGLNAVARLQGPGDYAAAPLNTVLERVKDDLKGASIPSSRIVTSLATCDAILRSLPALLPSDHPMAREIAAYAQNRRGDCLLLLQRPKEALPAYEAAIALAPDDAYLIYNRGRAKLALGDRSGAKVDFTTACDSRFKQPGARSLVRQALSELE